VVASTFCFWRTRVRKQCLWWFPFQHLIEHLINAQKNFLFAITSTSNTYVVSSAREGTYSLSLCRQTSTPKLGLASIKVESSEDPSNFLFENLQEGHGGLLVCKSTHPQEQNRTARVSTTTRTEHVKQKIQVASHSDHNRTCEAENKDENERNNSDITQRRSRLTGVQDLHGHVVANALTVPGTAVAKAGVVAAAPLEGQLSNSKCS